MEIIVKHAVGTPSRAATVIIAAVARGTLASCTP